MERIRFPYGISNFKILVTDGYLYFDRTIYLKKMEEMDTRYHFFLRPRRFGKSLAVSVMEYYYGKQHKGDFETLFGKYYIGQNPTPLANAYRVMKFDFSGIRTDSADSAEESFGREVEQYLRNFMSPLSDRIKPAEVERSLESQKAEQMLSSVLNLFSQKCPDEKIFLLIDEYDHFTNEIIAYHFNEFSKIVSRNGFVRKFFEMVKKGTQSGVIDRMFITGVSPVTLDSLTSGFNIGTNLSLKPGVHDFMGFTEEEVTSLLNMAGVPEADMPQTLSDIRSWYNGYLFTDEAANRLYNPDMVLYFAKEYRALKKYPRTLLDINISSDYGKIRRMLDVGDREMNHAVLEEVIREGQVVSALTEQFSFERDWTREDFVSLLFYMGMLTVKDLSFGQQVFQIPNHVITELYYTFFQQLLFQQANLQPGDLRISDRVVALAAHGDIGPMREALQIVLKNLDNRDARQFNEKQVKMVLLSLLVPTGIYAVFSEYAVGQDYADIVLLRRPPINDPKRQYVFELKHLKKSEEGRLEEVKEEGRQQLRRYLSHPVLGRHGDFTAYLWVVVGYEVVTVEEVR